MCKIMGRDQKQKCPSCNSNNVVPIVYGMPASELMEQAERGEVKLGGCVVTGEDPGLYCQDCGREFYKEVDRG